MQLGVNLWSSKFTAFRIMSKEPALLRDMRRGLCKSALQHMANMHALVHLLSEKLASLDLVVYLADVASAFHDAPPGKNMTNNAG
jgi:hypothetical protein